MKSYLLTRLCVQQDPPEFDHLRRVLRYVDAMLVARGGDVYHDISVEIGSLWCWGGLRGHFEGCRGDLSYLSLLSRLLRGVECSCTLRAVGLRQAKQTRVCVVDTGVDAEGKARGRQRAGDWGAPVEGELKLRGGEGKWWSLVDGDETR